MRLLSAGFEECRDQASTVAACCLQLMQRVPGGMLSASMCSRLQACVNSQGGSLHPHTLRIHLGSILSPKIHGVPPLALLT